jgi:hypothetical protein
MLSAANKPIMLSVVMLNVMVPFIVLGAYSQYFIFFVTLELVQ